MPPSLHAVVASALNIDVAEVSETSSIDTTPNWDSLRHVILVTEIERAYDFEFELDAIGKATSVHCIREMLAARGVQAD